MSDDAIGRLVEADPVRDFEPQIDEALLARIVGRPRPIERRAGEPAVLNDPSIRPVPGPAG
jgi:hypothetical protein